MYFNIWNQICLRLVSFDFIIENIQIVFTILNNYQIDFFLARDFQLIMNFSQVI